MKGDYAAYRRWFRTNGLAVFLVQPKNRRFAGLGYVYARVHEGLRLAVSYALFSVVSVPLCFKSPRFDGSGDNFSTGVSGGWCLVERVFSRETLVVGVCGQIV